MDQSAFYGIVSAINFTLLGLWWNAVKGRADIVGNASSRRTAYLVSLQFVILGTASLLAQVAPEVAIVWRTAFAAAGVVGAVSVVALATELRRTFDARHAPALFVLFGVPLNIAVIIVAAIPLPGDFAPIQIEAALVSLLVFLGVQEAWVVSMSPEKTAVRETEPQSR